MELSGDFETHFTLAIPNESEITRLQEWATRHALKLTHIVLARGVAPTQIMLTQEIRGDITSVFARVRTTHVCIALAPFTVTRVKIEAAPWCVGIPQTHADITADGYVDCYFEHHIKVLLDEGADLLALQNMVTPHYAHLSRNARRVRTDGKREYFVTQRCHGVGQREAKPQIEALTHVLEQGGYTLLEREEEFVFYDSNLGLDAGWIGEKERTCTK
jgi:hypothetical protein